MSELTRDQVKAMRAADGVLFRFDHTEADQADIRSTPGANTRTTPTRRSTTTSD